MLTNIDIPKGGFAVISRPPATHNPYFWYSFLYVRGEWFFWTESHCFHTRSKSFTLICPCVWVHACVSRTRAINIYAAWQGERKTSGVTETGWKSTGHKPWPLKTSIHTHTHRENCQTSGLPAKPLVGCQNHLLHPDSYKGVSSRSLEHKPTHTHPRTKSSLHRGPNKPSTRLAPSSSLSRNKLLGCLLWGCLSGREERFKALETSTQCLT